MANKEGDKMTTIQALPTVRKQEQPQAERPKLKPVTETIEVVTKAIQVPMLEGLTLGYVSRRADVNLPRASAETVAKIRLALERAESTLANGKPVKATSDAILWLVEQVSENPKVRNSLK
jgi:hypothetical protein